MLLFWSGPRPVRKGFEGPRFPFEGDPIQVELRIGPSSAEPMADLRQLTLAKSRCAKVALWGRQTPRIAWASFRIANDWATRETWQC